MNHPIQEQLREYFEYFDSLQSEFDVDKMTIPIRSLEQQPRPPRRGWAVAAGVAVATLAMVAIAVLVINALAGGPAQTTIPPAVTTTAPPVVTTIPSDSDPVVRDAGPAEETGWTWLDNGDVRFKTDHGAGIEIIGMVDAGVVLLEGRTEGGGCEQCVLQLWDHDGSVQSHQLDFVEGNTIAQTGVGADLIWTLLETGSVFDPDANLWVSADGEDWTHVEVTDPNGVLGRFGSAFEDLWSMRFLRRDDQVLAINMSNGQVSLSSNEGQTFEVIDRNAEFRGRRTNPIRRAWATEEGFFVSDSLGSLHPVYGRSPRIWHSTDGETWGLLGDAQGSPNWDFPDLPVAESPEPLVLPLPDGRLLTMDFINDSAGYISEDNGLSWEPIRGPYPYEGGAHGAVVNQGWMHVWEPEEQRVWVSADGYDWYWLPGRTASSGDPASGVFIDGNRIAIPPQAP